MTQTVLAPRWLRALSLIVPGDIRHDFVGNLAAERAELASRGAGRIRLNLILFRELLKGFVQHAPLRPVVVVRRPKPEVSDHAAFFGWIGWRLAGPAMLIGYLLGNWWVFGVGVFLLLGAYGALVAVALTAPRRLPERETRVFSGLLGGTLAGLLLLFVFGGATLGVLALASLFKSGLLAELAVNALVFVALMVIAGVTGSGWVPEEWTPSRLVENDDVQPAPRPKKAPAPAPAASGTPAEADRPTTAAAP